MDNSTKAFLQEEFRKYYYSRTAEVEIPNDVPSREFGYLTFDGAMVRHISCHDEGEVKALILKNIPMGFFYSVSKYEDPSLPIEDKGWMQADLVFDIDSGDLGLKCIQEHDFYLCNSCYTPYKNRIDSCRSCKSQDIVQVKWICQECIRETESESDKLQRILEDDLGISASKITRYFSGHRGFHVHVHDSGYEILDQNARAEIVDYLAGSGLSPRHFGFAARSAFFNPSKIPSPAEPGWRGRFARRVIELTSATNISEALNSLIEKNKGKLSESINSIIQSIAVKVDKGVTVDLHRIFRMPGTLHDKSGLIKKRYKEGEEPLLTAVGLGSFPVEIWVAYSPKFTLKGQSFGPFKNQVVKLPAYAAAFLCIKGLAKVRQRMNSV